MDGHSGRAVRFGSAKQRPRQAVAKSLGGPVSPQPVAKSTADSLLWQLPWEHHARIEQAVVPLDAEQRFFVTPYLQWILEVPESLWKSCKVR
jgi:hypothetical protein